ncbi:hypothetical protein [Ensifer sp. M14]|uniref:hypothetical protein n=1 Tax=Ensifer sp. M14 TaxID=2203782 RepID=UPI0011C03019|nr:hypothetical protein [Ensifer sp. M14]
MDGSSRKILIVASDGSLRRSLAFALQIEGYQVDLAEKLSLAIPRLSSFVCMLLDEELLAGESALWSSVGVDSSRIILLSQGATVVSNPPPAATVFTPFSMTDLLEAISTLARVRNI